MVTFTVCVAVAIARGQVRLSNYVRNIDLRSPLLSFSLK